MKPEAYIAAFAKGMGAAIGIWFVTIIVLGGVAGIIYAIFGKDPAVWQLFGCLSVIPLLLAYLFSLGVFSMSFSDAEPPEKPDDSPPNR